MASLADAITRALQKRKSEQEMEDSQKSPEQRKADDAAKTASYKEAKEKLGYSYANE